MTDNHDGVEVRPLADSDVAAAAALHRQVLDMEFISRCGPAFVRRYYRAWIDAGDAIALAAVGDGGRLAGVLLGATDPAAHTAAMVKKHGGALALRMGAATVTRPKLAREVVATRLNRYAGGLWRVLRRRLGSGGPAAAASERTSVPVAEVTHLLVAPDQQGRGVGRALVDAAARQAVGAGRRDMVLVTPPDMAARHFYERLGWVAEGEVTSRSGEPFVRYRLALV